VVHHAVAVSIATMIVVAEVGTVGMVAVVVAVAATMTATVVHLATMIASVAPTGVVTTMALVELTATLRAVAMIATAAAGTITVVEVEAAGLMAEMKDALHLTLMHLLGRLVSRTAEVETKNTVDRYSCQ